MKAKLSDIIPNPNNPRLIKDEKFKQLVKSIKDFPQMLELRPIVVNDQMVVLGGNMRLKACKEAGLKEVPIIKASELTEEQQREFIIKDNVGFGEWDWSMIANEWDAEQVIEWGLDIPDFKVEPEAEEDDYEIPDEIQTDIVLGDLFEIGEHRLLCGDSTDSDAVAKLMDGKTAELLFTSPPYSDMREYNGSKDLSVTNLIEFIPTFMPYANYQVINLGIQRKNNEINSYWDEYIEMAKSCGYKFLSWNVWVKPNASSIGQQTAMFPINIEWIFVFGNERKDLNRTIETVTGGKKAKNYIRNADGSKESKGSHIRNTHTYLPAAIQITQEGKPEGDHPATFPIEFPAQYIEAMTKQNEIVAESFTGSGTTMVAAHQLNRKCYGMELDPKYCQVIIDRMRKLDPNIQIKRNGEPYLNSEETANA